jgi:hypothetical protein
VDSFRERGGREALTAFRVVLPNATRRVPTPWTVQRGTRSAESLMFHVKH